MAVAEQVEPAAKRLKSSNGYEGTIDLDVGGTMFRASPSTLRKAPFLEALLRYREEDSLSSTTNRDGALFIDRCPKLFAEVLQFLRSNLVFAASESHSAHLRAEFAFFGLDPEEVRIAPPLRSEEVVVRSRIKDGISATSVDVHFLIYVHGPESVLQTMLPRLLGPSPRSGLEPNNGIHWKSESGTCISGESKRFSWQEQPLKIEVPAQELRDLGFRETGRSESSCSLYDNSDDTQVIWATETVTFRRQVH
eukprot:TRINITY_DN35925_c0_g1_i1.p1 TRINITY_DN35925_c0_g1~~TRINITY_DN35925_c0_g1_i1.p1  ORF type:complete len:268 (-),score=42.59 TRINITY_DN35925_c0_g1_i1:69-821(-)